jgi:hypothetical protein
MFFCGFLVEQAVRQLFFTYGFELERHRLKKPLLRFCPGRALNGYIKFERNTKPDSIFLKHHRPNPKAIPF